MAVHGATAVAAPAMVAIAMAATGATTAAARAATVGTTATEPGNGTAVARMAAAGQTMATAKTEDLVMAASVAVVMAYPTEALTPEEVPRVTFPTAVAWASAAPPMAATDSREEAHKAGKPGTMPRKP